MREGYNKRVEFRLYLNSGGDSREGWGSRYGNGDLHIPIWKWLITVSKWGLRICGSPFPYGDHHMKTGIVASPFPYRDCPFQYGDLTQIDPCYHTGIPIWKRGSTYPHMEMVNHRFHMGIENLWLPVSIWESPYGKGDCCVPISIQGLSVSMRGSNTNGSPLPYGDLDMGMGIDISPYGNG
jgi:hypothetical protein